MTAIRESLYCLPVIRKDDRFIPDQDAVGASDLLRYEDLKDYLADNYRTVESVVEVGGILHASKIFEPFSSCDAAYALVDCEGKPSSPPTLGILLGLATTEYFSAVRQAVCFSDAFPPSHSSYLGTEFVAPSFSDAEAPSSSRRVFSWKEVKKFTRALIEGPPGIGKTTCLRMLALEETKKTSDDPEARLPIYLQLRTLSPETLIWHSAMQAFTGLTVEREPESLLRSGRVLLLLDGLDEVEPVRRVSIVKQILELAAQWPTVSLLVTCRDSTAPSTLRGFTKLRVDPFDLARQDEWIRRRISRLGREAEKNMLTILRTSRAIGSIAGNPLLLAIAAAYVERMGVAPTRPTALVLRYIDALLDDWDEAKGLVRWSAVPASKQKKLEILCRSAFNSCRANRSWFLHDDFLRWEEGWSKHDQAAKALSMLWEHSGILEPSWHDVTRWSFTNSLLEEVLAARYLIERPDDLFGSVADQIDTDRLGRLWRYACELTQDATPLMNFMLKSKSFDDVSRAILVAQTLFDEVAIPHEVLRVCSEFVATTIGSLGNRLLLLRNEHAHGQWLFEAQWRSDAEGERQEFRNVGKLLRTLASGVPNQSRGELANALEQHAGGLGGAIAPQARVGGAIHEDIDDQAGRLRLTTEPL